MDQLVSNIIPTHRIGNDGFNWWVGQIEGTAADEKNNKGGYRFKVRIVGDHPGDPELVGTEDLPWASVMMPVTVPFIPGNGGGAHPQLEIGCWVIGFYMDTEKQKPIIMGSIGQTPGATKVFTERTPDTPPFTTAIPQINAQADGAPIQKDEGGNSTGKNTATGGLSDGTEDGDGNSRVNTPPKKVQPLKNKTAAAEDWCQSKAEKCDEEDMTSQLTGIMGEFLAAVQDSGGNIGTYVVNQANGVLMDGVNIARGYVNKAMRVVNEFVARVKGFIIEKLRAAVNDLIKALLRPSEDGNSLTPVTEFFNNLLANLGCSMADLGDRLFKFLTDILMSYVEQIYKSVACQIDALVGGIMSKINSLMNDLLSEILGPLSDILGAIAGPLNILGGAINFVLNLLGISCSGPDRTCSKYKQVCTNGGQELDKEGDFLDQLLSDIDNLFPATGADYTQYVCDDAYKGNTLKFTTIGFTGGVPKGSSGTGDIPDPDDQDFPNKGVKQTKRVTYNISDISVTEGEIATFTVVRKGFITGSSSVSFRTLKGGSATADVDYIPEQGILGFSPGETSKTIQVRTLTDSQREQDEEFKLSIKKNTPAEGSDVQTRFTKNIATCTITERKVKEPYDPYRGGSKNPDYENGVIFPPELTGPSDDDGDGVIGPPDRPTIEVGCSVDADCPFGYICVDGQCVPEPIRTVQVVADRDTCPEGEFIVYDITTTNFANGEILYYTLTGIGITSEDILGGNLNGNIVVNDNKSKITIGIEEDGVVEDAEILRLTINGTGAFADVVIVAKVDDDDFDDGDGDGPKTDIGEFLPPSVITEEVITDENGGIIDIPVSNPGSAWAEPPYVFVIGEGIGATATALLDNDGFLTEIRVKSPGFGYKKNLAGDNGKRCIIDSFTVVRPGIDYTEPPTIYVDGRTDVAEAIINDDGFLIGARILDRITTYEKYPEIIVVGGNGYGAKLLPSLACLDTDALVKIGSTKIGTGRYVDCP